MKTLIGELDRDGWEKYCQKLLKIKYNSDGYQEIPAKYKGDLGIEGYTFSGIAVQCYCPDGHPTSKELYEKQRNKITRDIGKLLKNGKELKKILGETIISEWHFLTPLYDNKDLLAHCTKQTQRVKKEKKSYISDNFKILVHTEDDFIEEISVLVNSGIRQIQPHIPDVTPECIADWGASNNKHIQTIEHKYSKIISDPDKLKSQIEHTVKNYIIGQNILEKLRNDIPSLYEKIIKLKTAMEDQITQLSVIHAEKTSGEHIQQIIDEYKSSLYKELNNSLESSSVIRLSNEAFADWLIGCSLDFR